MSTTRKTKTKKKQWPSHANSISPFYSFENHWLHLSRKVLCLTTWGTCMGGINEQFDDMLEDEASGDYVQENYEKELRKWQEERRKYAQYQPITNTNNGNYTNSTKHYSQQPLPSHTTKSKPIYSVQHKLLEYEYHPDKDIKNNKQIDNIEPTQSTPATDKKSSESFELIEDQVESKELEEDDTSPLLLPASPVQRRESQHIIGAKSMDRKVSLFNSAIDLKRRSTLRDIEWKEKHHPKTKKNFKPMDDDGMDEIEGYSAYPVGRGLVKQRSRAVSKIEKSEYMKTKADANAVKYNDPLANMDAKSKINLLNQRSVDNND